MVFSDFLTGARHIEVKSIDTWIANNTIFDLDLGAQNASTFIHESIHFYNNVNYDWIRSDLDERIAYSAEAIIKTAYNLTRLMDEIEKNVNNKKGRYIDSSGNPICSRIQRDFKSATNSFTYKNKKNGSLNIYAYKANGKTPQPVTVVDLILLQGLYGLKFNCSDIASEINRKMKKLGICCTVNCSHIADGPIK